MSLATTVRDAVVTALNGASLSPNLTALAIYELTIGLETLAGGRLAVMPATDDIELLTRAGNARHEITVHVGVQYKTAKQTPADQVKDLDPYLSLAESVIALFLKPNNSVGPCIRAKYPHGLWIEEHMKQFKVLTSVVALTFVVNQ